MLLHFADPLPLLNFHAEVSSNRYLKNTCTTKYQKQTLTYVAICYFTKVPILFDGEKTVFSMNGAGKTEYMCAKE